MKSLGFKWLDIPTPVFLCLLASAGHRGGQHGHSHRPARRGAHQSGHRGDRWAGQGGGRVGDLQLRGRGRCQGTSETHILGSRLGHSFHRVRFPTSADRTPPSHPDGRYTHTLTMCSFVRKLSHTMSCAQLLSFPGLAPPPAPHPEWLLDQPRQRSIVGVSTQRTKYNHTQLSTSENRKQIVFIYLLSLEPGDDGEWGLILSVLRPLCSWGPTMKRTLAVTASIWSQFPGTSRQECCCLSGINNSKVKLEGIQLHKTLLLSLSLSLSSLCVHACVCMCVITIDCITEQFIKLPSALLSRLWVWTGNTVWTCLLLMAQSDYW